MHPIDDLVISIYLVAIVIIGVMLQRKASQGVEGYSLGNRDLPWQVLSASGMASNTDIAGTMINTAMVCALGTMGLFVEIRGGAGYLGQRSMASATDRDARVAGVVFSRNSTTSPARVSAGPTPPSCAG